MQERLDLQGLLPYFREERAKGRSTRDIAKELNLSVSAYQNIVYYLRREAPPQEEEPLLIRPERPHKTEYVKVGDKVYTDVTREFTDCGG